MEHKQHKGFRSFLKEKGYYIVLLLCAVAVGISGYFLLTMDRTPVEAVTTAPSEKERRETPTPTVVRPTQAAKDALATEPEETVKQETTAEKKLETGHPLDGEVVAAFAADHLAYNVTTRDWRTHEGIDLGADLEQAVHAAAAGTVETIYEDERLGMTVVLRHSNGYTTHYSNLSEETTLRVGDKVALGEVIGTVGKTACTETGEASHLHFGVYRNNRPVDPEEFFEN